MAMKKLLAKYQVLLNTRPVLVQAVQTGLIMCVGDITAQTLVEGKRFSEIDANRTFRFGMVGATFVGPVLTMWYRQLDRLVPVGSSYLPLKKMVLDQFGFAPFFNFALLHVLGIVGGQSWPEVRRIVSKHYVDVMRANYCLWPMVQSVNFFAIPLNYQVLFVQMFAIIWNTYLSWKSESK